MDNSQFDTPNNNDNNQYSTNGNPINNNPDSANQATNPNDPSWLTGIVRSKAAWVAATGIALVLVVVAVFAFGSEDSENTEPVSSPEPETQTSTSAADSNSESKIAPHDDPNIVGQTWEQYTSDTKSLGETISFPTLGGQKYEMYQGLMDKHLEKGAASYNEHPVKQPGRNAAYAARKTGDNATFAGIENLNACDEIIVTQGSTVFTFIVMPMTEDPDARDSQLTECVTKQAEMAGKYENKADKKAVARTLDELTKPQYQSIVGKRTVNKNDTDVTNTMPGYPEGSDVLNKVGLLTLTTAGDSPDDRLVVQALLVNTKS